MNNGQSESEALIIPFLKKLTADISKDYPWNVKTNVTVKNAFSGNQWLISGLRKNNAQNKALVDEISATIFYKPIK